MFRWPSPPLYDATPWLSLNPRCRTSQKGRAYLDLRSGKDGPSTAAQIGQAIGSKPNVVSKYRNRIYRGGTDRISRIREG